jgi:hypothetical protein
LGFELKYSLKEFPHTLFLENKIPKVIKEPVNKKSLLDFS